MHDLIRAQKLSRHSQYAAYEQEWPGAAWS
jgi:hypothetical protein